MMMMTRGQALAREMCVVDILEPLLVLLLAMFL